MVIVLNKIKTYFSKPQNIILLLFGIVLTFTTVAPIVAIVEDTFKIHPGTIDAHLTGKATGYSVVNYVDLFTSKLARTNLWTPLLNTVLLAVFTCLISIVFGGVFAFLITRTNLKCKKYLSSIFIFPYIMPQWTLAVVWQNVFNSNAVTGTSNGLLASLFNITMPKWWCLGLFPSAVVLGLHYAPFAYILIGGIFRNMDANLEEAATILDTPKWKSHVPYYFTHGKTGDSFHNPAGIWKRHGKLSRTSLPGTDHSVHQVHLHELQVYRGSQYSCHHHDDLRCGDPVNEPDELKEP